MEGREGEHKDDLGKCGKVGNIREGGLRDFVQGNICGTSYLSHLGSEHYRLCCASFCGNLALIIH